MDKSERINYGIEQKKFFGIKEIKPNEWNDERIDELIEDIFNWCSNDNNSTYSPTEYFRVNRFYPATIKILRSLSDKFNEFYSSMEEYREQVIINKTLTGEFNVNFTTFFLKAKHRWVDEEKDNNKLLPTITINYPLLAPPAVNENDFLSLHVETTPDGKILPSIPSPEPHQSTILDETPTNTPVEPSTSTSTSITDIPNDDNTNEIPF